MYVWLPCGYTCMFCSYFWNFSSQNFSEVQCCKKTTGKIILIILHWIQKLTLKKFMKIMLLKPNVKEKKNNLISNNFVMSSQNIMNSVCTSVNANSIYVKLFQWKLWKMWNLHNIIIKFWKFSPDFWFLLLFYR